MTNEECARVSEIHSINSKKYIESLSEKERARRQERLYAARKSWWGNLPATEKEKNL